MMADQSFAAEIINQDESNVQLDISSNGLLSDEARSLGIGDGLKIKAYGRWGLYATKTEIVLYDLRQKIYWLSLLELGLMTIAFFLMIIFGRLLILLQLLHFIRPFFAFKLIEQLPKSHVIYEEMPDNLDDVSTFQPLVFAHFKRGSKAISVYVIVTALTSLIDLISLTIQLSSMDSDHIPHLLYAIFVWIFLGLDSFIVFWYCTMKFTFPQEIWYNLIKLARGSLDDAKWFLKNYFQSLQRYPNNEI